jgi:phage-related minor tail protein
MKIELIARKLETIRADLNNAAEMEHPTNRINALSIALELLTDIVEHLAQQQAATDRAMNDLASYHN